MTSISKKWAGYVLATTLMSSAADAYEFVPTDVEWQSWPGYCKAKYVLMPVGENSKFARRVTNIDRNQLRPWEAAGVRGVHHYCAGMIWLQRGWLESDTSKREYMLREALAETSFTFNGTRNKSSPQIADVTIQLARVKYEQGEYGQAIDILQEVSEQQPRTAVLYSAIAVIQKKSGDINEAKETLLHGLSMIDGESAEIHYNLGLIYLELGEVDSSVKHAELAYASGFPLQGLRMKLKRLGRM
jgi:tetratricopeptide (TPR) repeat protein